MSILGDKLRALAAEADAATGEAPAASLPVAPTLRLDYGREAYLEANPDVAAHVTFGKAPLRHWFDHGFLEKRPWPKLPPASVFTQMVMTPAGRAFPMPAPVSPDGKVGENLWGYFERVARHIGRSAEWNRTSASVMLGLNHLVPKSVPYPDGYANYFDDPNNWPAITEAHFFRAPQTADPGWAQVHERMKEGTHPAWQPDPVPAPTPVPPGEEPL